MGCQRTILLTGNGSSCSELANSECCHNSTSTEWCALAKWKQSDLRMKSSVTGGDLTSIPPMLNVEGLSYFAGLQSLEKLFGMVFQGYPETLMTSLDLWRLRPPPGQGTPVTWQEKLTFEWEMWVECLGTGLELDAYGRGTGAVVPCGGVWSSAGGCGGW